MAINYASVQNDRLAAIKAVTDQYTRLLKRVADQLEGRMIVLLSQNKPNTGDLTDVALARAQAQKLLIDSGYYRVTGQLQSTGYQEILNKNLRMYNQVYGAGLRFEGVDTARLNAIQQMSSQVFQDYAGQYATSFQRIIVDYNFGTASIAQSADVLRETLDTGLRKYAETIVNTQVMRFEREASNELTKAAGFDKYIYIGPLDKITREFCREHLKEGNNIKTFEQWSKIVAPDANGPVPEWAGGYNCRHSIVPYVEE